jgi:hypothetical protein
MKEIIMPHNSGTQIDSLPTGYTKYAVPDSLQEKDKIELFSEQVQAVVQKQIDIEHTIEIYKKEVSEYTQDIKKQTNRNIEIIGLFSSVLALLIINVNILNNATSFLSSIMLIIGLTSSIAIFSILIHSFFNSSSNNNIHKSFWIPFSILFLLLLFGIIVEATDMKYDTKKTNVESNTNATDRNKK